MGLALRDIGTLVFSECDDLIAIRNLRCAFNHNPMLGSVVVHLQG
jgi:hypothetical protein